jgi:hypothetical protein
MRVAGNSAGTSGTSIRLLKWSDGWWRAPTHMRDLLASRRRGGWGHPSGRRLGVTTAQPPQAACVRTDVRWVLPCQPRRSERGRHSAWFSATPCYARGRVTDTQMRAQPAEQSARERHSDGWADVPSASDRRHFEAYLIRTPAEAKRPAHRGPLSEPLRYSRAGHPLSSITETERLVYALGT